MKIVFLTVHDDAATMTAAAQAGARGYILKGVSGTEFVEVLMRIASDDAVVFPEMDDRHGANEFRSDRRMRGRETDVGRATKFLCAATRLSTRRRAPA